MNEKEDNVKEPISEPEFTLENFDWQWTMTDLNMMIMNNSMVTDNENTKRKPHSERGFVFYPSHLETYEALRDNGYPDLAIEFLEAIIYYGVRCEEVANDIIIKALMINIIPVIDKNYEKYYFYKTRDKHNKDFNVYDGLSPEAAKEIMEEIIFPNNK